MNTLETSQAAAGAAPESAPEPSPANGAMMAADIARHFERGRALQQQMVDALKARASENSEFAQALAKAQAGFKAISRTREVQVRTREGPGYTFRYAPLDVVLAAIMPALNAHGFALSQKIGKGEHGDYIETTLLHATGERSNRTPIFITAQTAQGYASGVTYARRYGVTLLVCVASEDDEDGNGADGNDVRHGPQPAGKKGAQKGSPKESRVELEPGEQRRAAHVEPAFPLPKRAGPESFEGDRQVDAPADEKAQTLAEGRIADAIQEFHEAALEGRRVGIEQIWSEIRGDEYVATQTWQRLKEQHPDSFRTVNEVLKPKDKAPRGPKK